VLEIWKVFVIFLVIMDSPRGHAHAWSVEPLGELGPWQRRKAVSLKMIALHIDDLFANYAITLGYSVQGMTMDYSSLCNFTVWHNYLAPAACTDNVANAADYYANFPAIGVFASSNSKRAARSVQRDVSILRRQTNTVPHYLKFTTGYIKQLCKFPGESFYFSPVIMRWDVRKHL
jgi:hypothetical protein